MRLSQRAGAARPGRVAADEALAPVASALPVLLLSGDFDPITPPAYAERLRPTLSNARHVVFPAGAHGQAMSDPCANRLIEAFLDDPAAALDTSCVAGRAGEFVTSEDVIFLGTLRSLLATEGLAAAAALVAIGCVAGLAVAVGSTLATNQNLAGMGAVPARWAFVTRLPALLGLVGLALAAAMAACWARGLRTLAGRLYLSLLSVAALVAAANLALLTR